MLTSKQKERIEWLKKYRDDRGGIMRSYMEWSASGISKTIRVRIDYFDTYYRVPRYKTFMVFSTPDDAKFEKMRKEAEILLKS